MKRLLPALISLLLLGGTTLAIADSFDRGHRRAEHGQSRNYRDQHHRTSRFRDQYRRALPTRDVRRPRHVVNVRHYRARLPDSRYYYRAPVHYHYHYGRYERHYGDCDSAYLWIGGAMVLTELIHHAYDGY
jgi:hypothetical protein